LTADSCSTKLTNPNPRDSGSFDSSFSFSSSAAGSSAGVSFSVGWERVGRVVVVGRKEKEEFDVS
jgi:hypothetical protein